MKLVLTIVFYFILSSSYAQTSKLYNPDADVSTVALNNVVSCDEI